MTTKEYRDRRFDPWAMLTWVLVMAVLVAILATEALSPVPELPTVRERAARFEVQEVYYNTLDRYGDITAAIQAAQLVWEEGTP